MKKIIPFILSIFFFTGLNLIAANRYWVGGTGEWNNIDHWALTSGGKNGAPLPTANDDVFFDTQSFKNQELTVMVNTSAVCRNIDWSAIQNKAVFSSSEKNSLTVHGFYKLSPLLLNGFKGKTIFAATSKKNTISTYGSLIIGNWIFLGTGSWLLADDIRMNKQSNIILERGSLNTNGKKINCGSFISNSTNTRSLNLSSSEITIHNQWNFENPTNLAFNAGTSQIIFIDSIDNAHYKSGNLKYNEVYVAASTCSPTSNPPCANFTITLTADSITCNGLSDGAAHAVITGGSGNFTYDWAGASTPAGEGTPNVTGLGPGSVSIKVTDNVSGLFCFCFVSIGTPDALFDYQVSNTAPKCFGDCNGSVSIGVAGGTGPYTYSWTGGLGTSTVATNVCDGSYVATVTDYHNCKATTNIIVKQPDLLIAPGDSTMISCFGACDGKASVNVSGGTTPYIYDWLPGSPVGDGTANVTKLCPSPPIYSCNVTDKNLCKATFTTTITEPKILTLALTGINASCGGICNGKATATITGGTAPYTYVWSNGSTTTTTGLTNGIIGLCASTTAYSVTVTDKNGCTKTASITITEPAALNIVITGTNVNCFGACDGSATAVVTGGSGGNIYNWTPGNPIGDSTLSIYNLCLGGYALTVRDKNGCTAADSVIITQPNLLIPNPTVTAVSCSGVCDGIVTAAPAGGTAPYTYKWNPGPPASANPTLTGLCAGNYSLLVTDKKGCDTVQTVSVTQPPLLVINTTQTNVLCNGACNGKANVTASGGTGATYTYAWAPGGQTTASVSNLCPGTYTVTVTDSKGCTKTKTVIITQPNPIISALTATSISCNSVCNASISGVVNGGTPTYKFLWAPGGETILPIINKCAGTYTLTIEDGNGCIKKDSVTIAQPTAIVFNSTPKSVSCFGLCDGYITTIAGGGQAPYSYSWSPGGQTTKDIFNQCPGTYTVTVTDKLMCTKSNVVTILPVTQLFANPSLINNASCAGSCDGSVTATPSGGTPPYNSYSWNPSGSINPTVTNLCQGTYSVTVKDANNCSSTQAVTITQPTPLNATISGSTSSCNVCTGTATVIATGGLKPYTYSWAPSGQTGATATGLCPNTTYTVTIKDSKGCTSSASVTILQTITINITTSSTVLSCVGSCDGIASANASGGTAPYKYLWDGPGGPRKDQTVTGLCIGSYTVTVVDTVGCFNTNIVTFTNPPPLTLTTLITNPTCASSCNGTATASPVGGTGAYTYLWMPSGQITKTATGLCAGTYTLTVTDSKNCKTTSSVVLTSPSAIIDNYSTIHPTCNNADGSLTVSPAGGTPSILGYTYAWGPGNPTGQGTKSITNLLPGVYTLTIKDSAGCTSSFNYLLNNIAGPLLTTTHTNISCDSACDGSATVIATGGTGSYVFSWIPSNPLGDSTASITALCGTTTYTVQVKDSLGCISLDTATIINPKPILSNVVIINESCGGSCNGKITVNPSGGIAPYKFLWMNGDTTKSIINLCVGNYSVKVTDKNGCVLHQTFQIIAPTLLTVNLLSTNVLCKNACNGTATATATGGTGAGTYTYSWTNQPIGTVLPNIINLCPKQYIVTVKDANNCIAKDTVDITEPLNALTASTLKKDVTCNSACNGMTIIVAAGGTTPYASYLWNPGTIANDTAIGLCPGTYNAIVTDANGCTASAPAVIINEPSLIMPKATFKNALCNKVCNGTATANPIGGTGAYTYTWMPGTLKTKSINALCAGTYTVIVTDSLNCSVNESITLTDPSIMIANTTATAPSCVGSCNGSVTANPLGGTPTYTYNWMPGGSMLQTVTNLCAGNYTVVITDINSCKDTQRVNIVNPLPINVIVGSTPSSCGSCDGTITVTPTAGTAPYKYNWSGGLVQNSATQQNVCAGVYTVTVSDALNCDSTFTVIVNNSSGPTGETITSKDITCNGMCTGMGSIIPIGGLAPYTFLWNDIPQTQNDTAVNLCAGNYIVKVTDANLCTRFSAVAITEPTPILTNAIITDAACSGVCTGAITLNPTGGAGKYISYKWLPGGETTANLTSLCPGTYTLTITDSSFCTKVDSFIVGQTSPLSATINAKNISCSSLCNGIAYVKITTGTPPYTIQWNDPLGQTHDTASALCAGNYSVNIKDALGCSITLSVSIKATSNTAVTSVITNATCGVCDGKAVLTPSGGLGSYTYLWSNGASTASVTNLCAGLYMVNVKDSTGCSSDIPVAISNTGGPTSIAITTVNNSCYGVCDGAVTSVIATGGVPPYSYLWMQSGQTTPTLLNLCAGKYHLQVTDAKGCSFIDSISILSPAPLVANQSITAATCGLCDGNITIAPSGGNAPYQIEWNTGATALSLTNLCAGVYSVKITAANNCFQNITIPMNSQKGPLLSITSTDVNCNGKCDGTAIVAATGGVLPYSYLWDNIPASTKDTALNLCTGKYFVQVTDQNKCVSILSTTITESSLLNFTTANAINPLCFGSLTGSITTIPSGGTLPYTYDWLPNVGNTATVSNLAAGTYSVTVKDAKGCSASQSMVLTQPSKLVVTDTLTQSTCNTVADGAIDVTTTGGIIPYKYQWSGASSATTQDLLNILSGTYIITVSDSNNCIAIDTVVLTSKQFVSANAGNDTTLCEAGMITLDAIKSINGINYQWFQLPSNNNVGNTIALSVKPPIGTTTYYVMVDNGIGCIDKDTVVVATNALPHADAGIDASIYIGKNVTIGGNPTTTTGGSTWLWTPSIGLDDPTKTNPIASPVVTTAYVVTITSAQGCVNTDTVIVKINPAIKIPSGITPNKDGVNDEWIIEGIELFPNCVVEVYNRWGELLFQSKGYEKQWQGTFNGKPLPVGTYYYIIDLREPTIPAYTGPVTIMR